MAQQQLAEFNGEVVRNVASTLRWYVRPLEQSKVLDLDRLANLHPDHNKDELQHAIKELTDNIRERCKAVDAVCSSFQSRLKEAAKNMAPDQEIDPDDIGVSALEKSEEYFHENRETLREIRDILQRIEGAETHGAEVFAELEQLDKQFEYLIASSQEIRWFILIHDGSLAQNTERTCKSGAEFMASLEKL